MRKETTISASVLRSFSPYMTKLDSRVCSKAFTMLSQSQVFLSQSCHNHPLNMNYLHWYAKYLSPMRNRYNWVGRAFAG